MNCHFGLESFFAQQASRFEARNAKEKAQIIFQDRKKGFLPRKVNNVSE
jgi:hypothetical protein